MSSKSRNGGALQDIIAVSGLAFIALGALVPIVMIVAFLSFPIAIIVAYLKTREIAPPQRPLTQPTVEASSLAQYRNKLSQGHSAIRETVQRGRMEGVHFLENEERFEMRSKRGQQLNRGLEAIRAEVSAIESAINQAIGPVQAANRAYAAAVSNWRRAMAVRYSMYISLTIFTISVLVMTAYNVTTGSSLLTFGRVLNAAQIAAFFSTSIAWVIGIISYFAARGFIESPAAR